MRKHITYNLQLWDLNTHQEAVSFIQKSIGDETAFVGMSGGKDSIVVEKLMKMSGVKYELYHSFTTIDAPEVVRFIRKNYPECKFLTTRKTFWQDLAVHVPPSDRLRWCCTSLKKESSWKLPHKKRIMGIRAEESPRRVSRGRINHIEKLDHTHYSPIFYWKEWQVWDFIDNNNLPYPKLYDWGFDRIGCIICPYHSEKTGKLHGMYKKYWPAYFKRWEKEISDLFTKRQNQGKTMHYATAKDFLNAWYLDDSSRWYK